MIYDFLYENLNFLYENLRFSQWKIWIIFSMIFLMIHKISFRLTRKFSLTNSCWVCSTLPILDKFRLCCFTPFCSHDVPVGRCQGLHHHWISTAIRLLRVCKRHVRWEGTCQRHKSTCDTLMLLNSTKNSPVAAGWNPQLLANWIEKKRLSNRYVWPKKGLN